jgi:hypothetical protein
MDGELMERAWYIVDGHAVVRQGTVEELLDHTRPHLADGTANPGYVGSGQVFWTEEALQSHYESLLPPSREEVGY